MSLVYLSLLYDYIFWFSSLNNPQVHVSFNHVKELARHWRNGQSSFFPAQQDLQFVKKIWFNIRILSITDHNQSSFA